MRKTAFGCTALLISSLILVGCGPTSPESKSQPDLANTASASATTSGTGRSGLVGVWQRVTTCKERVRALEHAGLGRFAAEHAAGEGWVPGVTSVDQLKDPTKPCQGAVPLLHEHFFSADGLFGSRDADGNQVDDGTYVLLDDRTVVITKEFGKVTFHVDIRGEQLFLEPVLPRCAKRGCFAAQWAVAVAYPGLPWQRR
jgi:hypothetical protein